MHALVVRNNSNPQAIDASMLLLAYFSSQSIETTLIDSSELNSAQARVKAAYAKRNGLALAVVLGGDGTILHTARLLAGWDAPILGINFGRLGFLANASEDGVVAMVARALAGELKSERRANLRIDVVCDGERDYYDDEEESLRAEADEGLFDYEPAYKGVLDEEELERAPFGVDTAGKHGVRTFFALNEISLTRGAMGRIIDFSLDVSDTHIADLRGDGIVVSTATGSTAYALSAGGPLVAPGFMGLITVPIAPHSLHARPLVTGENDVVRIDLTSKDSGREATLFADGDMLMFDRPVRRVYVRRGETPTHLLRSDGEGFYEYAAKTFF